VITRDRVEARLIDKPADLCSQVRSFASKVEAGDGAAAKAEGQQLDRVLVAPVREWLAGVRRLFVSPHLCLHALPWAALHDGSAFLVERMAVARMVPLLAARRLPRDDAPLFAGGPKHAWMVAYGADAPGLPPLPGVAPLGEVLAEKVSATVVLSGADLTPERFIEGASQVDAIFYGGHARYDDESPLKSALLVARSRATGIDQVEARSVLGLGHPLDLVMLVGCETARLWKARPKFSDDAMGLQRAFLAGGARHVVGALWPVLDRDAEDFVRAIESEGASLDVVDAVAAAQRCMVTGRCPARGVSAWASFVVDAR
jgi:CHAT domain-containing protein